MENRERKVWLHSLRARVKQMSETDMFKGGEIGIDNIVVELASKFGNMENIIRKLNEIRSMRVYDHRNTIPEEAS